MSISSPISLRLNLFPGGKARALTLSYDDDGLENRRLVEIFNRHGLKGTFHLNSGLLGKDRYLKGEDLKEVFQGHEVSAHGVTHPNLEALPKEQVAWEILEDRRVLESWVGYPVRGMSYPFGSYSPDVVAALPSLGIEYARTTGSVERFALPLNPLLWAPSCHHKGGILERLDSFMTTKAWGRGLLFYVWGHAFEFVNDNNWELIETFAAKAQELSEHIWFATNIEIHDYQNALKRLRVSVDRRIIENPSAQTVWFSVNEQPVELLGEEDWNFELRNSFFPRPQASLLDS